MKEIKVKSVPLTINGNYSVDNTKSNDQEVQKTIDQMASNGFSLFKVLPVLNGMALSNGISISSEGVGITYTESLMLFFEKHG